MKKFLALCSLLSGCDRPPEPAPPPVLQEEAAAFFWFNSRTIADAGNSMYGRFVYERFLPHVAPPAQRDPKAWFVLCDGDCMSAARHFADFFRPQDKAILDQAEKIGESLCYVVAVLGQTGKNWDDIDRDLRSVSGYLGMTMQRALDRNTFLNARQNMALPIAARIDGARFKKIGFAFLADEELRAMGFEPYSDK